MKNLFILFSIVVIFGCARKEKAEIERLNTVRDSILAEAQLKEQALNDFISSFNEIEENLRQIKDKENLITVSAKKGAELNLEAKDRINQDINLIYEMMQKNKKSIANLDKKLKAANIKIVELEQLIRNLTYQVQQKDSAIVELQAKLENMNIQITMLNTAVDTLTVSNTKKTKTIEEQTVSINTAFYAIGTKKELIDNKIITKEGGFIGLGKTTKVKSDFNKKYFTKIDIRKFKMLPIKMKKASIITTHPSESYKLYSTKKSADSLEIVNPVEFWESSKYLVILVE